MSGSRLCSDGSQHPFDVIGCKHVGGSCINNSLPWVATIYKRGGVCISMHLYKSKLAIVLDTIYIIT